MYALEFDAQGTAYAPADLNGTSARNKNNSISASGAVSAAGVLDATAPHWNINVNYQDEGFVDGINRVATGVYLIRLLYAVDQKAQVHATPSVSGSITVFGKMNSAQEAQVSTFLAGTGAANEDFTFMVIGGG